MKNLFKKLLACCMAVCMVLTLCVGAITVSAEAATGTVTAGTANIYTTDANAVVDVTAYAAGGIAAAEINVAVPADLSIAKLELATTDANVEVTYASAADPSGAPEVLDSNATASEVAPNVIDGVFTYIIHLPANTVTTAEVTVKITFAGTFAEGTTVVDVVDAEACYDANSDLIDLTIVDGAIVATVPHVCTAGTPVVENEVPADCDTDGSYDSVVYCTGCGEELSRETIPVKATGHAYDDGVVTTQPDCDDAGVKTFTCANCGGTYTEAVSPLGHTAGEPAEENRVEAAPGVAGSYDMVVRCTVCNAIISSESFEIPALPVGPVVDTQLVFRDTSIAYGASSLEISFRVRNTVLALYDDMEVVIIPQRYDPQTLNLVENPVEIATRKADLAAAGSSMKVYTYKDAYLYELGLEIQYFLRAYDANGTLVAVSEVFTTSGAQVAKEIFAKSSANPKMQTLLTDTLIVADESVNSMKTGKPDSDLAKAPSVLEGFDISAATKSYDGYNTIDDFNSFNPNVSTDKSAKHRVIKSVTIGKVPYPTYRVKDTGGVFDLDKFEFRVAYTQVDGAGNKTNFDQTYTTANSDAISLVNGYVNFKYETIALQDSNQNITFEFTYDGEVLFTSVYSMETFLGANLTNANTGALMDALIKLGVSFRAYSAK